MVDLGRGGGGEGTVVLTLSGTTLKSHHYFVGSTEKTIQQKPKKPPCKFFPKCRFGNNCHFQHPPCSSGSRLALKIMTAGTMLMKGYAEQGAKKVIFTACHSGKLKLAFTGP